MSDKPSYLKLLNAVSLAESAAHEYLEAWIAVTPSDDVRCVLQAVSVREGEHGKAFAKRINELGYTLRPREDPGAADRMALAASTELTDLQKMEKLGLGKLDSGDKPDIFDTFFNDHSIDIRTGELLGRYVCEERDSGRLLKGCYDQLEAAAGGTTASPGRLDALEAKVDQVCAAVTQLTDLISSQVAPNGTNGKAKRKVSA
jgi:hypothetical protein